MDAMNTMDTNSRDLHLSSLDTRTPVSSEDLWNILKTMHNENQSIYLPINATQALGEFRKLFTCKRGGACCTQEPSVRTPEEGGIGLKQDEIPRLARLKGLSVQDFLLRYCQTIPTGVSMKYPCPFYETGKCTIYDQRPLTCQIFPLDMIISPGGPMLGVQLTCPGGLIAAFKILREILPRR